MHPIITIDGPAGSGKSTVSRLLAKKLHCLYLDTGAMYRAVALAAIREGIQPDDGPRLGRLCNSLDLHFETEMDPPKLFLGDEDISAAIRTPEMDILASKVSAIQEVRECMTVLQRRMVGARGVVAEGRDMGTVVFPDAQHKFFLEATGQVRAERRHRERLARGESISESQVKLELLKRDRQDQTRTLAPLRPAEDAVTIHSDTKTAEQVMQEILKHIERKQER